MNDRTERDQLERVLDAYASSAESPSHASLVEWIRRYPQYERELTDFAVNWSRMEHLPAAPRTREVDTDTLVLRGMSIFRNIVHRKSSERATEASLDSIVVAAQRQGLSPQDLADRLELNLALVRKLDLRRIAYARIPDLLKELISAVIGHAQHAIETYLKRPPTLALGTQHRADQAPSPGPQEDFFDAVRAETDLNEQWRSHWLALEPPTEAMRDGASG